jgi:hypothetical protein
MTKQSVIESGPAPSTRQIAAYLSRKCEEHVTPADIRRWTGKGSQQFRAPDPSGCIHRLNVPADDWQKIADYFMACGFPREAAVEALARESWEEEVAECWGLGNVWERMRRRAPGFAREDGFRFRNSKSRWERMRGAENESLAGPPDCTACGRRSARASGKCSAHPSREAYVLACCRECFEAGAARHAVYRAEGRCHRCGSPAGGKYFCQECHAHLFPAEAKQ